MTTRFFESVKRAPAPVVPTTSKSPENGQNIVIQPRAATQWRVSDTRWPEHDARSLLGFIEIREDGLFEAMQLDHGFEWFSFDSFAEAAAHFTDAQPSVVPHQENVLLRLRAHA